MSEQTNEGEVAASMDASDSVSISNEGHISDTLGVGAEETADTKEVVAVFPCANCGACRGTIIQCKSCGDRIDDTESLSPYQRLALKPKALYHHSDIQSAKENLLIIFHPLKASRLNAKWSLKQRALICRDAKTLSSLSGALLTYVQYLHNTHHQLSKLLDWNVPIPNINQHGQQINLYLLQSAFEELQEYDGYQERERLFNQTMRALLNEAIGIAHKLHSYDGNLSSLEQLYAEIRAMQKIEYWLETQRQKMRLKIEGDDGQ